MRLENFDHVQLAMPQGQEERARAFYRDILGLPERIKPPHLARRGGAWFESEVVKIHLGVDNNFVAAKKAHPAILVSDLTELATRCRSSGYEVIDDEPLDGYNRFYVADPFGNRLEFLEKSTEGTNGIDALPSLVPMTPSFDSPNQNGTL